VANVRLGFVLRIEAPKLNGTDHNLMRQGGVWRAPPQTGLLLNPKCFRISSD
jgi:hypothetical protein